MRQFSLGTVLRMTDKFLLRRFFESFGADIEQVPWDDITRRNIDFLQRLFDELPSTDRDRAEVVLRHVHALAGEKGMESLGEAAETFHADASWNEFFLSEMNLYSKALSAWLDYQDIFDYAIQFFQVDTLSWWRKRVDLPMIEPNFDDDARTELEDEIASFFRTKQGRGYVCTIEMVERSNGVYYFFAYPDDYVRDTLVHDENENLVSQTIRQTFEIVFAYDRNEGSCDLYAKLSKTLKEELELIFLQRILDFAPEDEEKAPYDLSMLLDPTFQLTTRPEDNLDVRVTSLTLFWPGRAEISITPRGPLSPQELARQGIRFPLAQATVKKARFRFEFLVSGTGRSKTLTFEIGPPDACTLKNQQPDRVETVHRYLKEWGMEHEDENETATTATPRRLARPVA
ncbi:MAG TPA: hypothetical protein DEB39_03255 [Planctomycetaceae bacterium]|nr:hypothetical protein [Planctomycetaceae bacterium]